MTTSIHPRRPLLALGAALMAGLAGAAPRPSKLYTIEQFMATTSVRDASFSPDETKVLFSSNQTGIFNAYVLPVGGGTPTPLTASTTDAIAAVSYFPGAERILFTRDQRGHEVHHPYVEGTDGGGQDLTPAQRVEAGCAVG